MIQRGIFTAFLEILTNCQITVSSPFHRSEWTRLVGVFRSNVACRFIPACTFHKLPLKAPFCFFCYTKHVITNTNVSLQFRIHTISRVCVFSKPSHFRQVMLFAARTCKWEWFTVVLSSGVYLQAFDEFTKSELQMLDPKRIIGQTEIWNSDENIEIGFDENKALQAHAMWVCNLVWMPANIQSIEITACNEANKAFCCRLRSESIDHISDRSMMSFVTRTQIFVFKQKQRLLFIYKTWSIAHIGTVICFESCSVAESTWSTVVVADFWYCVVVADFWYSMMIYMARPIRF